jgi:hypothetical protein
MVAVAKDAGWQGKECKGPNDNEIIRPATLKAIAQASTDERSNSAGGEAQKR